MPQIIRVLLTSSLELRAVMNKAKQAVNEAAAELRAKFSKRST